LTIIKSIWQSISFRWTPEWIWIRL